jgi:ribosomal protein S12 methylthiotransferase accessory factor
MLRFHDEVLDAPTRIRDGTHRAATLEATWKRFSPAAKRAGITRIADLTGLDTLGIPVFTAIRPLGKSLSTQQGKGVSPEAARISALMESLETYSAENLTLPVIRGSYRSLEQRHRLADARHLPRARRFDPNATLAWVEGFDLIAGEPVLVPRDSVTLDTTFTRPPVFDISSNGLASGNVLVEAIVHGLCEVHERHAESLWRLEGGDRRLVLDSIPDATCRALIDRVAASGARVFVWDLGGEHVAAIGAAIIEDPREPAWRPLGVYQGFGAHLLPEIAIARAITEAAQTRLTYIAGGRDDFFPHDYDRATDPELHGETWAHATSPCEEPVLFADLPRHVTRGLGDDLEILVDGLGSVIVVDVTHPELRVPAVKVLVPGLATRLEGLG